MKPPGLAQPNDVQNLAYLEGFYAAYRRDPASVAPEWREYFAGFGNGNGNGGATQLGPSFRSRGFLAAPGTGAVAAGTELAGSPAGSLSDRLNQLIHNHRFRGHIIASVNPLGPTQPCPPELELNYYNFSPRDLDLLVNSPAFPSETPLTVREIFRRLREIYCRSIGVQFMHIDNLAMREWLQRRLENPAAHATILRDQQIRILTRLTDAVVFEQFLRTKFLGAKTFSLEGCETLLPLLDLAIEKAGHQGVNNIIMGMGHRGRLNVLAHVAGKDPCEIFREFADASPDLWRQHGDVKYHFGHSGDWTTADGRKIHISICFNPSHLEFVDPVVLGRVRARRDRAEPGGQTLGVLVHGDAAFAGEGVVQETLNLSRLPAYAVGGALHIVVNNQIGFTTSPEEGRSTLYCTDVARMLQVPIFHVNGEDPEAVAQVVQLAMDFRAEFQSDVFIDMYGYRRLGHNETDEPSFTQPVLYHKIAARPNIRDSYLDRLLQLRSVSREEADKLLVERRAHLENQLQAAAWVGTPPRHGRWPAGPGLVGGRSARIGNSGRARRPHSPRRAGHGARHVQSAARDSL
jgi:2-oxoglutarate dehydrogenase E1 component